MKEMWLLREHRGRERAKRWCLCLFILEIHTIYTLRLVIYEWDAFFCVCIVTVCCYSFSCSISFLDSTIDVEYRIKVSFKKAQELRLSIRSPALSPARSLSLSLSPSLSCSCSCSGRTCMYPKMCTTLLRPQNRQQHRCCSSIIIITA